MLDCLCVGLSTMDVIASVDGWPREDEKRRARAVVVDGGGPAGTAACVLGKYGLKTGILSFIGQDEWTPFIREGFRRHDVSTKSLRVVPGASNAVSMVLANARNGSRTIVWNARGLRGESLPVRAPRARCLHFDGHLMELSIRLAREGLRRGALTSFDCGSLKPGWEALAALTRVFIASSRFTRQLGLSVPAALLALRERFGFSVAVTEGARGVSFFDEKSRRVRRLPQRRFASVDTTGCGDVFHGAFLAAALRGRAFEESLRFAQEVAGEKSLRLGGRKGLPERRL
ncbi:MAG TPA: hypothetical protein DCM05_10535 [Elusimicrobia bacterium]|nr:hypothetical protein [Elusimicrobiota bacterium]